MAHEISNGLRFQDYLRGFFIGKLVSRSGKPTGEHHRGGVSDIPISGAVSVRARFRRLHAGDRGLIAAPWTPLASLCCRQ